MLVRKLAADINAAYTAPTAGTAAAGDAGKQPPASFATELRRVLERFKVQASRADGVGGS